MIARGTEFECRVAIFLIDTWCLGVKDCFVRAMTEQDIHDYLTRSGELHKVTPSAAKAFLLQAVDYGKSLGFSPIGDYPKCYQFFHDIVADPDAEPYTFGKDGMPLYMAGPRDDSRFQQQVMATLEKTVGQGNYHFILPVPE